MSEQIRCAARREARFLAIASVWCAGLMILGLLV